MRRIFFLLTLGLYAWSATEMHEWVRMPQVLSHLLEHHSDFGHHDGDGTQHDHGALPASEHDHSPFDDGCGHEFCACGASALIATRPQVLLVAAVGAVLSVENTAVGTYIDSYSGSKWNPPRIA
jgi:hypothetical protein